MIASFYSLSFIPQLYFECMYVTRWYGVGIKSFQGKSSNYSGKVFFAFGKDEKQFFLLLFCRYKIS